MDARTFDEIVKTAYDRRMSIMGLKGIDYDKVEEGDRLSSFKEVAVILNILRVDGRSDHSPYEVASVLLVLKLVRDANLRALGKEPMNENRTDTLDDLHNYLDLRLAIEEDSSARS